MASASKSKGASGARKKSGSMYLSRLKVDEMLNVLRFVSARPASANWQSYLAPTDACNFLHAESVFSEVLRDRLDAGGVRSEVVSGSVSTGTELVCPCNPEYIMGKRIFEILLYLVGPGIQRISIDFPQSDFRDLEGLLERSKNLKYLQVKAKFDVAPVLAVCAGKLLHLDIRGVLLTRSNVLGIARHCRGLEVLKLKFHNSEMKIDDIWRTVGPTLRDLSIDVPLLVDKEGNPVDGQTSPFEGISKHCTRLRVLGIGGARRYRDALFRLCEDLGDQIETMRFMESGDVPSVGKLPSVLKALSNARFDAPVVWDQAETMALFGHRMATLRIENREFPHMEEGAAALVKLESVHISLRDAAISNFLNRLFTTPSKHLRTLSIDTRLYSHDFDLFDVIAKHVTTLEYFTFSLQVFQGSFAKFAQANQNLKKVVFEHRLDDLPMDNLALLLNAEREAVKVVKQFGYCAKLEEITVNNRFLLKDSKVIQNACLALGRKHLDVFIGGTQYRTSKFM